MSFELDQKLNSISSNGFENEVVERDSVDLVKFWNLLKEDLNGENDIYRSCKELIIGVARSNLKTSGLRLYFNHIANIVPEERNQREITQCLTYLTGSRCHLFESKLIFFHPDDEYEERELDYDEVHDLLKFNSVSDNQGNEYEDAKNLVRPIFVVTSFGEKVFLSIKSDEADGKI